MDGLTDASEFAHSTSPNDADTDGDGMSDGWEVAHGFDPLDPEVALDETLVYNLPVIVLLVAVVLSTTVLYTSRRRIQDAIQSQHSSRQ